LSRRSVRLLLRLVLRYDAAVKRARIAGEGDVGGVAGGRVVAEEQAGGLVVFGVTSSSRVGVGEAVLRQVGRLVFDEALGDERRERGEHGGDDAVVGREGAGRDDLPVGRTGADEVTGGAPRCFTVMEVMAAGSSLRIAGLAGVAVEAVSGVLRCSDQ